MNKPSIAFSRMRVNALIKVSLAVACLVVASGAVLAQETGGELGGGAGIFRPKNPEAKRSGNPARPPRPRMSPAEIRSEEHTSELQSQSNLVCRLLLEKKKQKTYTVIA